MWSHMKLIQSASYDSHEQKVSEYDLEIQQSNTEDQPMAP